MGDRRSENCNNQKQNVRIRGLPQDRGSLLQHCRDAVLSMSSANADLTGGEKEHHISTGAEQKANKRRWCRGLAPRELRRRKRQKGKVGFFSYQLHPPGAAGGSAPFGHVHLPGHLGCRTAAGELGGRAVQGYRNDIKIQTRGSLLPSALLALLEIEL